jgi:ClpP class serine protease
LTQEERARAEELIRTLYADFVKKVATGRGMPEASVDAVGQGRIWSGTRGKEKGLVDEIGGLWRSVEIARTAAGIPAEREIQFMEGPSIGAFRLPLPTMSLLGIGGSGARELPAANPSVGGGDLPLGGVAALEDAAGQRLSMSQYEKAFLELVLRSPGVPLLLTEPILPAWGIEP